MNSQKNQFQNKVVKAGAGYIIGNYLLKGITFLSAPIFTRLLSTEEYGRFGATKEEIIEAAKIANVHHFIKTLPDGYNMFLNEEASNISQGQRQLITIARAFLANPEILILDEATSSVDTRTEILIQQAMEKLLAGRTSFVVAHRLSTIRDADNIIVMNHGSIVETGNHDTLMEKDGFYADLYNSQFAR